MNALSVPQAASTATAASDFAGSRAATTIAGPGGGEPARHAEPDAAIAAGDDCDTPGKIEQRHFGQTPERAPTAPK